MWEHMGKVQDTISKIGQRTGLRGPHKDIALQVPEQRPATAGSFPTDAASVGNYLAELEAVQSESVAPELIRALQHSNRLVNTPSVRLQITRLFEPAARDALKDLSAGFTDVDLPYTAASAHDFEQATTLLQELSASYKVILLDVLRRRGHLPRKLRLPVIFQAMKHLSECSLRISQSYQPCPDKLWRDLNTLYLCAEREQGVDTEVRGGENPRTIRHLYSQCCAFSACTGSHLPSFYLSQLHSLLGRHSDVLDLKNNRDGRNRDSLYSVALDSAHPPSVAKFSRYLPGQQVRFFDMEPLLERLPVSEGNDAQDLLSVSEQTSVPDHTWVSQLRKGADGRANRQYARSIRHSQLHTETGIKEIHASLLPFAGNQSSGTSHAQNRQYGTQWIVENSSRGGLGLKWTGNGNCRINVGELIAHQEPSIADQSANSSWHIGIVRWIKSDGRVDLHCGVETLANYAAAVTTSPPARHLPEPTTTSARAPHDTKEALLLNEHPAASRPPMLLVARHLYRIGERVNIWHASNNQLVKLVENFPVGGNFDCFGFQPV